MKISQEEKHENHIKSCRNWRAENKQTVSEYNRNYRLNHKQTTIRRIRNGLSEEERAERRIKRNTLHSKKRRAEIINAPGSGVSKEDQCRILEKYNYKCLACKTTENITIDHIIPLSKGGPHSPNNIQPLCVRCNSKKGTKTIDYRINYQSSDNISEAI